MDSVLRGVRWRQRGGLKSCCVKGLTPMSTNMGITVPPFAVPPLMRNPNTITMICYVLPLGFE
eukprot:2840386-Heterocapsa_arctica.AAC.1